MESRKKPYRTSKISRGEPEKCNKKALIGWKKF
jgi:hypothetical protein